MAQSKEPLKPLFPLKHEFYRSLDNYVQQASLLSESVHTALELGAIDERIAPTIKKLLDEFRAARFSDAD